MFSDRVNVAVTAIRDRHNVGFTLVEMLIVMIALGVLSAIVLPKFSGASHIARENNLKDDLLYLRTQVAMFRAQHKGVAPGYPDGNTSDTPSAEHFVRQMTNASDGAGNIGEPSDRHPYGPYLQYIPPNPLNGKNSVLIVSDDQPMPPPGMPDNSTGWIYKPLTLQIIPNSPGVDADGTRYTGY